MTSLPQPSRANTTTSSSSTLDQPPVRRTLFPQSGSTRRPAAATVKPLDFSTPDTSSSGILAKDKDGRVMMDSLLEVELPEVPQENDQEAERAMLS